MKIAKTKFRVDYIFGKDAYGLIVVTYLSGVKDFEITCNSKLDNVQLDEYLDMPRKIDERGNQMLDSFILKPKNKDDLIKFQKGQILDLI